MTRLFTLLLLLAVLSAKGQTNGLTPPPPPTNVMRHFAAPKQLLAATNITLSWAPYTNVLIHILGTTNGTDWTEVTNLPIWATNVVIPINAQMQLFTFTNCTYQP